MTRKTFTTNYRKYYTKPTIYIFSQETCTQEQEMLKSHNIEKRFGEPVTNTGGLKLEGFGTQKNENNEHIL